MATITEDSRQHSELFCTDAEMTTAIRVDQFDINRPLKAAEYGHLLHLGEHQPLALHDCCLTNSSISFAEETQMNGKTQCDALATANALDSGTRGLITFPAGERSQNGQKRKRSKHVPAGLHYPKLNWDGTAINHGHGGDLSFLDAPSPVVCKQSCTFLAVTPGQKVLEGNHYAVRHASIVSDCC